MSAPAVWVVTALALILLGGLAAIRRVPGAERLQRAVYTSALTAGHIPTPPSHQF